MRQNIIRIEHPNDGKGLWRSLDKNEEALIYNHSEFDAIFSRHDDKSKFPTFYSDRELFSQFDYTGENIKDYNFAFKSLNQLEEALERKWITEILEMGFKILMLDVTDYYESQYQVVFKKSSITSQKDISSLFQ